MPSSLGSTASASPAAATSSDERRTWRTEKENVIENRFLPNHHGVLHHTVQYSLPSQQRVLLDCLRRSVCLWDWVRHWRYRLLRPLEQRETMERHPSQIPGRGGRRGVNQSCQNSANC